MNKSFKDFTSDEIISKINIDERLIEPFKKVMNRLEKYFESNNLLDVKDYGEYLVKYLLNSGKNNMEFYVDKIERKGENGTYFQDLNKIRINEKLLSENSDKLEATLCHEFIHFLVMHSLEKNNLYDNLYNVGFINEALTEMLTQEIYPNNNAYDAQVSMQKYANLISGNENNYRKFLQGSIDAQIGNPNWLSYVRECNHFQEEFFKKGYINLIEAQTNTHFINAQRSLISLFVKPESVDSFERYCDKYKKLLKRPVSDQEYIDNVIFKMNNSFINNLGIKDDNLIRLFNNKLSEARNLIDSMEKYNGKSVYEFEFCNQKFALDERYNIIPDIISGMQKGWNPNTRTITLRMNNQKMDIKVDEINFYEREKMIARKLEDIKTIFSDKVKVDIPMVDKALSFNENIIKIEKFILPDIDKKNKEIYIATTEDNKIYVINDFTKIGNISNIPIMRFIGQTKDITYSDKIGNLESGNVYTTLSEKRIESKILAEILKNITSSINQDSLNYAINQYKGSQNYDGESIEEIKDIILSNAAKEKYNSMSESEKEHIKNEILKKEDRIVISYKDNQPLACLLRSNDNCIYMADSKLIYSKKEKGIFNDLYEIIKNNSEKQNSNTPNELEQNLSDNQQLENNSTKKEQQIVQHSDAVNLEINNYMKTRIKSLTNIQISNNKGYEENGQIILKSKQELQSEKDKMKEIIEDLYFNNRIDSNEKNKLIQFIAEEYKNMILNAPNLINNSLDNNERKYDEMLDEIENLTDKQKKKEEKKSKLTPEQMEKIVSDFGKWYEQNNEENEMLNNQQNNNIINSPKYEEKVEQIDNVPNEFKVAYNNVIYNYLLEKYKFEKGYEYMNEEQKEEFDYVFEIERASQEKNESKEFIQERKKSWDKIKQLLINNPNMDLETIIKQVEFNDYDKMDENEYSDESDKDIVENVERTGKRSFR